MGRPSSSRRLRREHCAVIDIAQIERVEPTYSYREVRADTLCSEFLPEPAEDRTARLRLTSYYGGEEFLELPILVTHPYFGGIRQWFACPRCQRRVGKLFSPRGHPWACRHCYRLVYRSQYQKSRLFKLLRFVRMVRFFSKSIGGLT
jgi:hypothetical protein